MWHQITKKKKRKKEKKEEEREAPATPRNCETIKLDLNIEKTFCKEKKNPRQPPQLTNDKSERK